MRNRAATIFRSQRDSRVAAVALVLWLGSSVLVAQLGCALGSAGVGMPLDAHSPAVVHLLGAGTEHHVDELGTHCSLPGSDYSWLITPAVAPADLAVGLFLIAPVLLVRLRGGRTEEPPRARGDPPPPRHAPLFIFFHRLLLPAQNDAAAGH